jgi:hypothetical protein
MDFCFSYRSRVDISPRQNVDKHLTRWFFFVHRLVTRATAHGEIAMKTLSIVLLTVLSAFTLACGYSSHATTPPAAGTMPNIALLNPDNANSGTSFQLIITGTGFNGNATVNFNGTQTPTAATSTQITVAIPDSAVMAAGTVQVTVTNPGTAGGMYGGGTSAETSHSMPFTIN